MRKAILLFLLLLISNTIYAATWTVGSGKSYSTIQSACDAIYSYYGTSAFTATETVEVYNGTYNEQVTPNTNLEPTATYRLVLTAATGNKPVIDGQKIKTFGININNINYVTINGFTVNSPTTSSIYFQSGSLYSIVSNNITDDGYSNSPSIGYATGSHFPIIYNNTCSRTGAGISAAATGSGIAYNNYCYSNVGGGIYLSNSSTWLIYNNITWNNAYGIQASGSTDTTIYNNTCYNNVAYGLYFSSGSSQIISKNNIFAVKNSTYCYFMSADSYVGLISNYNDFTYGTGSSGVAFVGIVCATLSSWQGYSGQDANSISSNPFISLGNFKGALNNPCIDIGTDLSGIFTTDYFGTTRPTGAWDIGAYECIGRVNVTRKLFANRKVGVRK